MLKYVNIKIKDNNHWNKNTKTATVRYRLRPEMRFFYVMKQALNERLYRIHLECAKIWNSLWQYMQTCISQNLNVSMDNLYLRLNRKLNNVCETAQSKNNTHKQYYVSYTHTKFVMSELQ